MRNAKLKKLKTSLMIIHAWVAIFFDYYYQVAITFWSLEREVWGSNLWSVKLGIVLWTVRHRCDIFLEETVMLGSNDEKDGPHKLATPFDVIQQV